MEAHPADGKRLEAMTLDEMDVLEPREPSSAQRIARNKRGPPAAGPFFSVCAGF
jgi:hypothetical protein